MSLASQVTRIVFILCTITSFDSLADPVPAIVSVFFSPRGGAAGAVIQQLGRAQKEIRVQAYSFTHAGIARALVNARERGVDVAIILDKSNRSGKYSAADFTSHMGVPTFIDSAHAIAHNKIIVIDEETVITGSFNFTKAADEKNAENLIVLRSAPLARQYLNNWTQHVRHSQPYRGR